MPEAAGSHRCAGAAAAGDEIFTPGLVGGDPANRELSRSGVETATLGSSIADLLQRWSNPAVQPAQRLPDLATLGCGNTVGLVPKAITQDLLAVARPLRQVRLTLSCRLLFHPCINPCILFMYQFPCILPFNQQQTL